MTEVAVEVGRNNDVHGRAASLIAALEAKKYAPFSCDDPSRTTSVGTVDRCGSLTSVKPQHCRQGSVDAPQFLGTQVAAEISEP